MLNPMALSRGSHYLENAWRLAVLAELAYRNDPAAGLLPFADHYRRIQPFSAAATFGFIATDEKNLVISLRGTDEVADWVTNLTVAQVRGFGGHVHQGFASSLNLVWAEVLSRVENLLDNDQTVWITGHSLGGALATIAAVRLLDAGIEPYVTCTFGAPRAFDPQASSAYLPRLYRFVNKGDLVPSVPPPFTLPWYRYQHTGSLSVTLDKDRGLAARLDGQEQDAFSYLKWLFSGRIDIRKHLTQALADHAMKSYIALIKNELGPEAVARLEAGRSAVGPIPLRIKPRRALAA